MLKFAPFLFSHAIDTLDWLSSPFLIPHAFIGIRVYRVSDNMLGFHLRSKRFLGVLCAFCCLSARKSVKKRKMHKTSTETLAMQATGLYTDFK